MQDLTADEVLEEIGNSLRNPIEASPLGARLSHVRDLQRRFRAEPIGGRLTGLKRIFHWFTASAFDRQAKVQEATADLLESVIQELARPRPEQRRRGIDPALEELLEVFKAPGEMPAADKLLLYGLAHALRPRTVLLLGAEHTGSASILCGAMDASGLGRLVVVGAATRLGYGVVERIHHRTTILQGPATTALSEAALVPEGFELVVVAGELLEVPASIETIMASLAERASLVLLDYHRPGVDELLKDVLGRVPALTDGGMLSTTRTTPRGSPWGGMHIFRYARGVGSGTP